MGASWHVQVKCMCVYCACGDGHFWQLTIAHFSKKPFKKILLVQQSINHYNRNDFFTIFKQYLLRIKSQNMFLKARPGSCHFTSTYFRNNTDFDFNQAPAILKHHICILLSALLSSTVSQLPSSRQRFVWIKYVRCDF